MKVALCGYGVVGQGVATILDEQMPNKLKYIFTKETLKDSRYVDAVNHFLNDPEVGIVVETMGGIVAPFEILSMALKHKKHVVSSNKALIAAHGSELQALARAHGVNIFFEASVGGGIPLLSMMRNGLSKEPITKVSAILNGTTNYILTLMRQDGLSFAEALKQAQDKGYAEKDPTDDITGRDTARKIAILGSMLTQKTVDFEAVSLKGIDQLNATHFNLAKERNARIRLMASLELADAGVHAWVEPVLVGPSHPFYSVDGVENAVLFEGKYVGAVLVQGAGAGRFPTASAVVSDILACEAGLNYRHAWSDEPVVLLEDDFDVIDVKTGKQLKKSQAPSLDVLRVVD